jgi:hypothetical protein
VPTPEWFAENPKISAYISPEINDALKAWMEQNRVKKVSQALTTILEQHLGLVDAPKVISEGQYATLEQLQELTARVETLEEDGSLKKTTAKPKAKAVAKPDPKATEQLNIINDSSDDGWMTTREAYENYGTSISYDGFRKSNDERLMRDFRIETDQSRKTGNGKTDKWLRRV